MMKAVMQSQISFTKQTTQAIGDIRTQLTAAVGQVQQERERFPSQPQVKVAGTHFVGNPSGTSNLNPSLEEAKAITTLRSGKEIDKIIPPKQKPVPPPELVAAPIVSPDLGSDPEKEKESESSKVEVLAPAAAMTPSPPIAPYAHRLVVKSKVNVLKDLCTSKWRTKSQDEVLLTEQVSSILQANMPNQMQRPCSTIPIAIASQKFDKALLELGTSVNLLPYSVYLKLGLGDLRATSVTLQLADWIDFIVLDTCPIPEVFEKTLIILGHPFLSTSSAVMNYKIGQVQMSFGDLKIEVNVFNVDSQVKDNEEVYEVRLIDTLVQKHVNNILYKDPRR
ncbi:uncharacterized protein LOC131317260 [Rhododendron vialii]|uniref:uncharacterized protein LOC131317260 n=1 Tax=Rhododendron vialii TaxID=182163 RepID=UPI00265F9BCC|nr:uncharacterized protein LOC131317260 [Rhododendron vialii]